ncbi:MAG TPA: PilZ domain-containing protein [Vicinamibacterales bacterium]|nr:PilZ domain-containing protein [Vicinamibacterales bacterium]
MASGLALYNRRAAERLAPERTPWQRSALLRPGQEVVLVNLSAGGALVESPTRLAPGARTELHLFGSPRCSVRGRVERCRVARLAPLRYEAVVIFEHLLEVPGMERCHG